MKDLQQLQPPTQQIKTDKKRKMTEKEQIEQQLIDNAWKVMYLHYSHYNWMDQKAQWFLTIIGAIEGYFIINFFLNYKFDAMDLSGFFMVFALMIGGLILAIYIGILQGKPFYNGPDIQAQATDFRPDGEISDLRRDTLATLKISYQENVKVINFKARIFKMSIWVICLYFAALAGYFIVVKQHTQDIPNDILLGINL
ncbi:hypothetical protein AGMMS50249_3750 [candidate division SR1 bacterium]|nr:hypothetical protein AGMMS50249_3750 [candidate division SR1 bacterium]